MNALCMVAHPDDCFIFAYSFINHWAQFKWTIAYLTYTDPDPRAQEFGAFWKSKNIPTIFLGHVDDYRDIESGVCSFDTDVAAKQIEELVKQFSIILTHDKAGDYGHPHHKFVNSEVSKHHHNVITFAGINAGTHKYSIDMSSYNLDDLPLHKDVIKGFHHSNHSNEYTIPENFYETVNGSRL